MTTSNWQYYLGNGRSQPMTAVPDAPAWRQFMKADEFTRKKQEDKPADSEASKMRWTRLQELAEEDERGKERGDSFQLYESDEQDVLNAVNAAIHLRRPLLVTGKPGSGKTSLVYAVARELKLGVVLSWAISARSQLQEALYRYDAVARLQDVNLKITRTMGDYIRLGPVGTAFLPSHLPRVLLIDEIDKCDINLPNDLLNLFEEGRYEIPELVRCKEETRNVEVRTADSDEKATIWDGKVLCYEFPFVVMTSNGERDFPPAFLRRCLRLQMPDPIKKQEALVQIVASHLKRGKDPNQVKKLLDEITKLVGEFEGNKKIKKDDIATDQLLNVVYLLTREVKPGTNERESLEKLLLKGLSEEF